MGTDAGRNIKKSFKIFSPADLVDLEKSRPKGPVRDGNSKI